MNWLESIIYAFISGLAEFLPVSSRAHQSIMRQLFGVSESTAVLDFLVHFAILLALFFICQSQLAAMRRTQKLLSIPPKRRKYQPDKEIAAMSRLVKTACIPVLIFTVFYVLADKVTSQLQIMAFCLLLNGVALYAVTHLRSGDKKASQLTSVDGLLIGFISGVGIIPGFSRVGLGLSISHMRGAAAKNAVDWALLISIPALIGLCIADLILMFSAGIGTFTFLMLIQYLVSAFAAYLGAYLSISLLHFLSVKVGFSWFSFYCWGLGLFSFILFML